MNYWSAKVINADATVLSWLLLNIQIFSLQRYEPFLLSVYLPPAIFCCFCSQVLVTTETPKRQFRHIYLTTSTATQEGLKWYERVKFKKILEENTYILRA